MKSWVSYLQDANIVQLSFLKMLNCQCRYGSKHPLVTFLACFTLVQPPPPGYWESTTQVKPSEMIAKEPQLYCTLYHIIAEVS